MQCPHCTSENYREQTAKQEEATRIMLISQGEYDLPGKPRYYFRCKQIYRTWDETYRLCGVCGHREVIYKKNKKYVLHEKVGLGFYKSLEELLTRAKESIFQVMPKEASDGYYRILTEKEFFEKKKKEQIEFIEEGWMYVKYDTMSPSASELLTLPKKTGCHITKVLCYGLDLPDDCHELMEIRRFRDEYLNKEGYSNEVEEYYANSEYYAGKIEKKAQEELILYKTLYEKYIVPAVKAIESNTMGDAHAILKDYLNFVKSL